MEPCDERGGSRLGEQLGKEFLDVQRPKAIFLCYLYEQPSKKCKTKKKKRRKQQQKKKEIKPKFCVLSFLYPMVPGCTQAWGWALHLGAERSEVGLTRTGCSNGVELRVRDGAAVDSISQRPLRCTHVIAAAQWERGGGRAGAMAEVGR